MWYFVPGSLLLVSALEILASVSLTMTQTVKIPRPPMQETQEMRVWSLGWEDPPKKEMAIKILVSYSPWGCRVRYDWATKHTVLSTAPWRQRYYYTHFTDETQRLRELLVTQLKGADAIISGDRLMLLEESICVGLFKCWENLSV